MFESNVPAGGPSNADDNAHTFPQHQLKCVCGRCSSCTTPKLLPDLGLSPTTDTSWAATNATSEASSTNGSAELSSRRGHAASQSHAAKRRRWERELEQRQMTYMQGRYQPLRELANRIAFAMTSPARARDMARSVALFEKAVRAEQFANITVDDTHTFVYYLRKAETREPTLVRHLANLSSLVTLCTRHGVLPAHTVNPFKEMAASLRRRAAPSECRVGPLPTVELQRLLTAPQFAAARDAAEDARAARFWLTLTALLTGARGLELMGATVSDLQRQGKTWMLRVPETRPRATGGFESRRWVPLHDQLIRCGLLAYAAKRKLAGHVHLFASASERQPRSAALASVNRWLSRLTRSLGLAPGRQNLAALRYNYIRACFDSGMPMELVQQVTGARVYLNTSRRLWELSLQSAAMPYWDAAFMTRVSFEGVDLSHLYVDEPLEGVDSAFAPFDIDHP